MVIDCEEKSYHGEVLSSEGLVLTYFQSEWCSTCKGLAPIVEKLSETFSDKVKFVRIDTLKTPQIALENAVLSTPTLILFKDGKEVKRNIGFLPEQKLRAMIEASL